MLNTALSIVKDHLGHYKFEDRILSMHQQGIDIGNQSHGRNTCKKMILICYEFFVS